MLDLEYDLFSLPTAQHKAGLAGLLLLIDVMKKRGAPNVPEIGNAGRGIVKLRLDEESSQALFDEVYDAAMVEKPQRTKRKDKNKKEELAPIRTYEETSSDRKTGKEKKVTWYVYEDLRPKGQLLKDLGAPSPWLRLWQDALWSTLRGIPLTRTPYEERLKGRHANEGAKTWASLQHSAKTRAKGRLFAEDISSSVFLGAQANSAEKAPFLGRPEENLLLHFWPLVARVFRPEVIGRDGKAQFQGYVFAVPDVADLDGFVSQYAESIPQLGNGLGRWVPADAVISLPQEGALEYAHALLSLTRARARAQEIAFTLSAVEVFWLEKAGNSIHTLSSERISVGRALLGQYDALRRRYRNPLFMAQVIRNLLHAEPLYRDFAKLFETGPKEWFIGSASFFPACAKEFMKDLSQTIS